MSHTVHELGREAEVAREAARAAGEIVTGYFQRSPESWEKSEDHPVTAADLEANQAIIEIISKALPGDAILSEEAIDNPERLAHERVWVCDPLDGTKEFMAGIPEFAISIALTHSGVPIVGVVYQPLSDECFLAERGHGAYLNEEALLVSTVGKLEDAQVLASRTESSRGQLDSYESWVREFIPMGSVALKLARIAAGDSDLWLSAVPKSEWDVCAGDLLVREAGGVFATSDDGERGYNARDPKLLAPMAAGPRALVDDFLARCRA